MGAGYAWLGGCVSSGSRFRAQRLQRPLVGDRDRTHTRCEIVPAPGRDHSRQFSYDWRLVFKDADRQIERDAQT